MEAEAEVAWAEEALRRADEQRGAREAEAKSSDSRRQGRVVRMSGCQGQGQGQGRVGLGRHHVHRNTQTFFLLFLRIQTYSLAHTDKVLRDANLRSFCSVSRSSLSRSSLSRSLSRCRSQ